MLFKKRTQYAISIFTCTIICFLLCSCGTSKTNYNDALESKPAEVESSDLNAGNTNIVINQKVIKHYRYELDSSDFDTTLKELNSKLEEESGYIEKSDINSHKVENDKSLRKADITARIPADKSDEFNTYISENFYVSTSSISTDDVTGDYLDNESRISALESTKSALEDLLGKSSNLTDILTIQDKLADVISQLESYKSKLQHYDEQITYSTVTIKLFETVDDVENQSYWGGIGTNLVSNLKIIGSFFVNLFSIIVSGLPFIIILGIIITLIVIFNKRLIKRKKEQRKKLEDNLLNNHTHSL